MMLPWLCVILDSITVCVPPCRFSIIPQRTHQATAANGGGWAVHVGRCRTFRVLFIVCWLPQMSVWGVSRVGYLACCLAACSTTFTAARRLILRTGRADSPLRRQGCRRSVPASSPVVKQWLQRACRLCVHGMCCRLQLPTPAVSCCICAGSRAAIP